MLFIREITSSVAEIKNYCFLCVFIIRIMNKKTVLNKLSLLKERLSIQYGVSKIGLFGSVIRGENRKNSDIDILIDFQEGKETYQNFLSVCDLLEELFQKHKLDIVTLKGLSPFIGKQILNEVEYA